jgi:hypothetical protein
MFLFVWKSADLRLQTAFHPLVQCVKYVRGVQFIFAKEFSYNAEDSEMAQAFNRWGVIAEAWVLFEAAPRGVCGGQIALAQGFRVVQFIFAKECSYNAEGSEMAQAFNRWAVIAETWVLSPAAVMDKLALAKACRGVQFIFAK